MLSRASVTGNRIRKTYRLENIRKYGKSKREPREHVSIRLKPSTIELNEWLAKKGWAPPGKCNGGRAIDFYTKRFYWVWVTPYEWPDFRRSTMDILREMVELAKEGRPYFPDIELIAHPNVGRLIDYLAAYWYTYEGGIKSTY